MVTSRKQRSRRRSNQPQIKSIKLKFSAEKATAFGGFALIERMALGKGFWQLISKSLPKRRGRYSWLEIIKPAVCGLLSGSRGTVSCEEVGSDEALLDILGLEQAPEEVTFWRALQQLGQGKLDSLLGDVQRLWAKRLVASMPRPSILRHGFIPLFGDGSLLEGSLRREGTKYIKNKGAGLMWSAWIFGPALAAQRLAGKGEGEQSTLRSMLSHVLRDVIDPLNFRDKTLVLMDSLHGDGPTLDQIESEQLLYIVGANKLGTTEQTLSERSECEWIETGARPQLGWGESAVCQCWVQCEDWPHKRLLIGRRWKPDNELPNMPYEYAGVMTNLTEEIVRDRMGADASFVKSVWNLYDMKGGCEDLFKDVLEDLSGHTPPCQELERNRGYYRLVSLAHLLGCGLDQIGLADPQRGSDKRLDGGKRRRPKPRRMRLWRVRRLVLAIPARVSIHARCATVTLLGLRDKKIEWLTECFTRLSEA